MRIMRHKLLSVVLLLCLTHGTALHAAEETNPPTAHRLEASLLFLDNAWYIGQCHFFPDSKIDDSVLWNLELQLTYLWSPWRHFGLGAFLDYSKPFNDVNNESCYACFNQIDEALPEEATRLDILRFGAVFEGRWVLADGRVELPAALFLGMFLPFMEYGYNGMGFSILARFGVRVWVTDRWAVGLGVEAGIENSWWVSGEGDGYLTGIHLIRVPLTVAHRF